MHFSKKFYLFFTILIVYSFAYSQKITEVQIDSIFNELKVKPNSIQKVDDLFSLYKTSDRNKVLNENIIDEAIIVAKKILYIKGLGKCYDRKGYVSRKNYDFSNSLIYHKRALNYLNKTTDTLAIIKCLNNLGVTYRKLNLEKEAFDFYFQALDVSEKIKHSRSVAIALNGIGNVFIDTKEYDKALYYFKRVYKFDLSSENIKGQEYSLSNIGEAYLYEKEYDSAFYYFNKALNLSIKHKHKLSEAYRYNLLGRLFLKKGDFNKSISYYNKAVPILEDFNEVRYLSNTLINIGVNQLKTKELSKAKNNINLGLTKAKSIKSRENIIIAHEALTEYYSQTNNYKKALESQQMATTIKDSVLNEASQKSIISTQIAYETAKKDDVIQELATEKTKIEKDAETNYHRLLISIFGGSTILAALAVMFYLYRKNSDLEIENKNNELQKYIHQINELKNNPKTNTLTAENFEEFGLSKREIEVFKHITNGLSNDEIAEKMFVSKNTIKTHIKNIYSKLDVKNRIQAIKKITTI
ncbi:tetratricopeptide repeat protein [Lutibacter sp. TH_r2]|uniref:tetratricopeptide repeat protein n=1 Tax=Lutibacter sp. TH_r2 TaxID=3082083 RepID=UPI002954FA18|nr:tetratricopeptide repeat protein [Lutibacter sp. TH_r2]MDV7186668.1 tetratricopeptide repeat protein [Lutibacter sp. TH_r2]